MSNLLESFPTLNNNLIEKSGYKVNQIMINYMKNKAIRDLELMPIDDKQYYYLDDSFGSWTPEEDNLNINMECSILDKNILFNEDYGIANKKSVLGIAVNYYCRETNKNISKNIIEVKYDKDNPRLKFNINLKFNKGELAGILGINILLYLKNSYENDIFANNSGTVLGIYSKFEISLEGNGSIFSIKIANNKNKPLWFAEFNFTNVYEDLFESSNTCLYLNRAHPDYKSLNAEGTTISPLMKEIISEYIALFIEEVLTYENAEDICSTKYEEEQAIGNVAKYWLEFFNVKTISFKDILYSIKNMVDKLID